MKLPWLLLIVSWKSGNIPIPQGFVDVGGAQLSCWPLKKGEICSVESMRVTETETVLPFFLNKCARPPVSGSWLDDSVIPWLCESERSYYLQLSFLPSEFCISFSTWLGKRWCGQESSRCHTCSIPVGSCSSWSGASCGCRDNRISSLEASVK